MKTLQKSLLTVTVIAALQACTSLPPENPNLTAAQMQFKSAQNSPDVPALASNELRDAEITLEQARTAWGNKVKTSEVDHLAYLASKKVAIAQTVTTQRLAEQSINAAPGQRQQTLLVARTLEVDTVQRVAESAQLDARLAELKAKQSDRGMVVVIGDLLFDTNRAVLKPGAGQSVQRLATFLQAYPTRTALIEGYTDNVGSDASNQSLSERRAVSVKNALLALGVESQRLVTHGYGEDFPVESNESVAGRLSNRRVEVILSDDSGKTRLR